MLDYPTLKIIWWLLVGVLLVGFAIMDGHDMGVGSMLPFVGKNDVERRVVISTVGPHWDGNQVWFITGGGAIFAAWPLVYATAFSGFYWAMLAVLWALFFRPVGFDYRSKIHNATWRSVWDWGLFIGGFVPPVIFGVAFGNLLQGVPFGFDSYLISTYTGSFWQLLNPFGLLAGVVSLSMLMLHGATWLMMRTEGDIARRSQRAAQLTALAYLAAFIGAGAWLWLGNIQGFALAAAIDTNAAINPLGKSVLHDNAGWLANYAQYPLTKLAPLTGILGGTLALAAASGKRGAWAFLGSSLAITGTLCTAGFAMFPFIMPSSLDLNSSLTLWDAVSSHKTLGIMFVAACIFVPLILVYTLWCYTKMWGKVTTGQIEQNSHGLY